MFTSSTYWLTIFVALPIFWFLPRKHRLAFLGFVSYGYLLAVDVKSVMALSVLTVLFYYLAPRAKGARPIKKITSALVVGTLIYLSYFKYLPGLISAFAGEPTLQKAIIPLGISYFTFKLVHYAVEVGRDKIPAHSISDFFCYLFLAPIFTAGPIQRFDRFLIERQPEWDAQSMAEGFTRIAHGLIKKFLIANVLIMSLFGSVSDVSVLLERLHELPTYKVWGFFALSFVYLYFDFSAYSDIAIGTSRLFGLRIMENFDWPLLATDLGAFWKRWHMTLAGWCQTYVYLPLIGLSRNPYLASYASFITMGLWHSASLGWVAWGAWHATGICCLVWWMQVKRRRKWKGLAKPGIRYLGIPLTMSWVFAGGVFPMVGPTGGGSEIFRVLCKLVGYNL